MATRSTHTVRCRSKTNPTLFVDVTVLDAVVIIRPDGTLLLISITPSLTGVNRVPCTIDNTGDGNAVGEPSFCSRLSHMEQFISSIDPSQVVDLEILDGFCLQPPNIGDTQDTIPEVNDESNKGGYLDSGHFWGSQTAFITQSSKAKPNIVDTTGLGLAVPGGSTATRGCHINLVTDKGNTDDKTAQANGVPPVGQPFMATIRTDAISFGTTNVNNILLSIPPSKVVEIDTTKYVTDPYTGEENAPPDNTDPNIYAFFPPNSAGASLGVDPVSQQTGVVGPPSMGMFWWIKKISAAPQPWYWYAPPQTYLAFSAFFLDGASPCCRQYGYRGFQLLNFFPVDYGLGANFPLRPMGSFGSPSLDLCAREGNWGSSDLRSFAFYPGVGFGPPGPYGPFGELPLIDPPLTKVSARSNPLYGSLDFPFLPNIWQLTGLPQPNLTHPSLDWDPVTNPYLWPSSDLAERAANAFADNWNSVANACNAIETTWVPCGVYGCDGAHPVPGPGFGIPPAGWRWDIPFPADGVHFFGPINTGLPVFGTTLAFQNAIPPGLGAGLTAPGALTIDVYSPVNIFTMRVGGAHPGLQPQDFLDPAIWDTTPSVVPASDAAKPPKLRPLNP